MSAGEEERPGAEPTPEGLADTLPDGRRVTQPGTPVAAPRRAPAREGRVFGPYAILSTLAEGGMGVVYRARDPAGRDVALKVVRPDHATSGGVARFLREGEALAAAGGHPNVVAVHTAGVERGHPYLVLDLVEGPSLRDLLESGPLAPERAAFIAAGLARAVAHVHRAGVLHRDIKPANVLVRAEDGEPLLTDFGLAALEGARRLTRTGDLLGTPFYMAPEQILGRTEAVDARTDVWGLGLVLYEMLSGSPPFVGSDVTELSANITRAPLPPLRKLSPGIDPALETIVARALAKEADQRHPGAAALAEELEAWLAGSQPVAPGERSSLLRVLLIGGAAVWLLLGGLLVGRVIQERRARATARAELERLEAELAFLAEDLLGREARAPDAAALELLEARLGALDAQVRGDAELELARGEVAQALQRARFERALHEGAPAAAARALDALSPALPERPILGARLATARGAPLARDELEALARAPDAAVAEAARVLLARALAEEEPQRALSLLETRVRPELQARERPVPELFLALRESDDGRVRELSPGLEDSTLRARAHALALAQVAAACAEDPPARLLNALRAAAALRPPGPPAGDPALAAQVVARGVLAAARDDAERVRSEIELLDAAARSGLRLGDAPEAEALGARLRSLRAVSQTLSELDLTRAMLAFVGLDLRIRESYLLQIQPATLEELPEGPQRFYLHLRVKIAQRSQAATARAALRDFLERGDAARVLGPIHRARTLTEASQTELPLGRAQALLDEAATLDPSSPWTPAARAWRHAQAGERAAARREAERADAAYRALNPRRHSSDRRTLLRTLIRVHARIGARERAGVLLDELGLSVPPAEVQELSRVARELLREAAREE